ncbi:MAG: DUF5320 domain-containing protein [Candidatus Margulisbacteria bacterium]|nr:DUF5320 domain-containing protein [Candidatus Margulisiibacteriota bacterium]
MPGGDGTGPWGQGPGTGWGRGGCVPFARGARFGRGRGFGFGSGFGFGRGVTARPYTAEEELEYLKQERTSIDNDIRELEKEAKKR